MTRVQESHYTEDNSRTTAAATTVVCVSVPPEPLRLSTSLSGLLTASILRQWERYDITGTLVKKFLNSSTTCGNSICSSTFTG